MHRGIGDSEHSNTMSNRGKNTTYDKIAQRFFWHNIAADISGYVKSCEQCQYYTVFQKFQIDLLGLHFITTLSYKGSVVT